MQANPDTTWHKDKMGLLPQVFRVRRQKMYPGISINTLKGDVNILWKSKFLPQHEVCKNIIRKAG